MPMDKFLIAPIDSGLQTDLKAWQILDTSFAKLQNAYTFRGRVRKRFGSQLMGTGSNNPLLSRLRINLANTGGGAGNFSGNLYTLLGDTSFTIAKGQGFSVGDNFYTITATGTPTIMLRNDGRVGTSTIDTSAYGSSGTSGNIVINNTGLAATAVYFYPSLPVMGLTQYQTNSINNWPAFAFDTKYAYSFTSWASGWNESYVNSTYPVFHGTYQQFFWTTNWAGSSDSLTTMYVTNFNVTIGVVGASPTDDPIWRFDTTNGWVPMSYEPIAALNVGNIQPITVTTTVGGAIGKPANYIQSALIILPFHNRLVMLNTIENNANGVASAWDSTSPTTTGITPANYVGSTNTQYKNRCRFSHYGNPLSQNAWLEPNQSYSPDAHSAGTIVYGDGGNFIDASTEEAIVSAEFVRDRLIVYFERSTWELVYTDNQIYPFTWQQLNTELGSQATFSTIPDDKAATTIGNTGIHSCSGSLVQRIDQKIPDYIFEFTVEGNAQTQTCGIRDYDTELYYWSYIRDPAPFVIYPNNVLVFNYKNGSWAVNDDTITAFGYFEQSDDLVWENANFSWQDSGSTTWNSNFSVAQQREILLGNQQGFVVILDTDWPQNAQNLQITNATYADNVVTLTVINHNMSDEDFIYIQNLTGLTITQTALPITPIYPVFVSDANTILIQNVIATGLYTGGGTLARVSNIQILTKQFNPYDKQAKNVYIAKAEFLVDKTSTGEITVDYYPSSSDLSMIESGDATGMIMGTNVLETFPYTAYYGLEQQQERLWHPVFFQSVGETIQFSFYYSESEITNVNIALLDFQLHAMLLYTEPAGRLQ